MILSKELRELYICMTRIRIVEETIAEKYKEQKMRCPAHLSTVQEAVSAAVGMVLRKDDLTVSTHRLHGHYYKMNNVHTISMENGLTGLLVKDII